MTPHLSVVIAARNDGYGGDFLDRMGRFLGVLFGVGSRLGIDGELIIVEWNPPADRPRIAQAIDWERYPRRLPVRIVEVPARFHARIENSDVIPLHEYIAKNVGVRRAHGSFVLATNPDLLYSKPLLRLLARGRLADDSFYRVDRIDVLSDLLTERRSTASASASVMSGG